MALFLIAAPLMGYLATSGAVQKMPLVFSLLSCLLVVLLEIVFSVLYAFKGLSMNDSFAISMANLPRFFLNTRDFDFFVLVLAVLAINFVSERYLRRGVFILDAPFLISSVALAMSILVGFLNGGRGLLMCLVFSVSLSLIRLGSSLSRFLLMFWSAACLALSSLLLRIIRVSLDIALSNTFNGFLSLARDGSGGRLSLWGQWLSSVKTFEDFVFGNGLSLPSGIVVAVDSFPSNPHNLLIEFFVKGGFVLVAIILIFVARYMRILFVKNQRLFASLSLLIAPILLYSLIAAPFEWPSGLWVIGLAVFGVGFYEGGCLNILGARSCLFSRLVPSLAQVYVLAVAFVFSVLSVRFLFVKQIELIPGILLK